MMMDDTVILAMTRKKATQRLSILNNFCNCMVWDANKPAEDSLNSWQ